jgi:hypothetical protein
MAVASSAAFASGALPSGAMGALPSGVGTHDFVHSKWGPSLVVRPPTHWHESKSGMAVQALGYVQMSPSSLQKRPLAAVSFVGHGSVMERTGHAVPASPKPVHEKRPPEQTQLAFAAKVTHGARKVQTCPSSLQLALATSAKLTGHGGAADDTALELDELDEPEPHAMARAPIETAEMAAARRRARVGATSIPDLYQHLAVEM